MKDRNVFRMETFGNEVFWTDAVRLPQGVMAAKFTPIDALKAGYHVNVEALDNKTRRAMAAELATDLSPARAPMLNNPVTTAALVNGRAAEELLGEVGGRFTWLVRGTRRASVL